MKNIITLLAVLGMSTFAFAGEPTENDVIASCYGDHHGSYLDFTYVSEAGKPTEVTITVSTDAGDAVVIAPYKVSLIQKDSAAIQVGSEMQAIVDVINDMNEDQEHNGTLFVRAENSEKSQMYLNLNKMDGTSYLVTDGWVEPLTCKVSDEGL